MDSPPPSFRSLVGLQPSTASTADSVLVIIDAQNEYATGALAVRDVEVSRKVNASLLKKYRDAGAPVIHVVHQTPPGAPLFTQGTTLAEEMDELKPQGSEGIVTKNFPSSFTGTNLKEQVTKTGRNKLVLTGYMAHVCVSTTARHATEQGYDVIIVEDAVGDRDIPGVDGRTLTKIALAELADAFATVIKSDSITA